MKKSHPPSTGKDDPTLVFPDGSEFSSESPKIDPQAMLQRIAENMSRRKITPDEAARRAAEKIDVEFVL